MKKLDGVVLAGGSVVAAAIAVGGEVEQVEEQGEEYGDKLDKEEKKVVKKDQEEEYGEEEEVVKDGNSGNNGNNGNNGNEESYMYQTAGHALVPWLADALGIRLFRGRIGFSSLMSSSSSSSSSSSKPSGRAAAAPSSSSSSVGLSVGASRGLKLESESESQSQSWCQGQGQGQGPNHGQDQDQDQRQKQSQSYSQSYSQAGSGRSVHGQSSLLPPLDAETQSLFDLLSRIINTLNDSSSSGSSSGDKKRNGGGDDGTVDPDDNPDEKKVTAIASGAIYSTYQRVRIEAVAARLGLVSMAWLWEGEENFGGAGDDGAGDDGDLEDSRGKRHRRNRHSSSKKNKSKLLGSLGDLGLEARIVKVASGALDEGFLWRDLADERTRTDMRVRLDRLERFCGHGSLSLSLSLPWDRQEKKKKRQRQDRWAAMLGEGGEFETLVLDGPWPVFKKRVLVPRSRVHVVAGGSGSAGVRLDLDVDVNMGLGLDDDGDDGIGDRVRLVDKTGDGNGGDDDDDDDQAWMKNLARPPLLSARFRRLLERVEIREKRRKRDWIKHDGNDSASDGDGDGSNDLEKKMAAARLKDVQGAEKGRNISTHPIRTAQWSVKRIGSLLFVGNMMADVKRDHDIHDVNTPAATQLQVILERLVRTMESLALGGSDEALNNLSSGSAAAATTATQTSSNNNNNNNNNSKPPLLSSVIQTTIILRTLTPSVFADLNATYARFFTFEGPPARVTVSCGGDEHGGGKEEEKEEEEVLLLPDGVDVVMSAIIDLKTLMDLVRKGVGNEDSPRGDGRRKRGGGKSDREALHVQSQSFWAPANIGPYSQAVAVGVDMGTSWIGNGEEAGRADVEDVEDGGGEEEEEEEEIMNEKMVFVSGQIPLVPSTMDVVRWEDLGGDDDYKYKYKNKNENRNRRMAENSQSYTAPEEVKAEAEAKFKAKATAKNTFALQTTLSLQHLHRVSRAMDVESWFGGIAFISSGGGRSGEEGEDEDEKHGTSAGKNDDDDQEATRKAHITNACWKRALLAGRQPTRKRKRKAVRRKRDSDGVGFTNTTTTTASDSKATSATAIQDDSDTSSDFSGGDMDPWDRLYGYGRFGGVEMMSTATTTTTAAETAAGAAGATGTTTAQNDTNEVPNGEMNGKTNEASEASETTSESESESESDFSFSSSSDNDNDNENDENSNIQHQHRKLPLAPCYTVQMDTLPRDVAVEWTGIGYTGSTAAWGTYRDDGRGGGVGSGTVRVGTSFFDGSSAGNNTGTGTGTGHDYAHSSSYTYTYIPLHSLDVDDKNDDDNDGNGQDDVLRLLRERTGGAGEEESGHVTLYATPVLLRYLARSCYGSSSNGNSSNNGNSVVTDDKRDRKSRASGSFTDGNEGGGGGGGGGGGEGAWRLPDQIIPCRRVWDGVQGLVGLGVLFCSSSSSSSSSSLGGC